MATAPIVVIDTTAPKCPKCEGCGQIASGDDGAPWTFWANLPRGSDLAVQMGIVRPITCPTCGGAGRQKPRAYSVEEASEAIRALLATEPNLRELKDGLRRIVKKMEGKR